MMTRRRCMQSVLSTACLGGLGRTGACRLHAREPDGKAVQPDLELELRATTTELPLFDGPKTPVWRFQGKLIKGRKGALIPSDSYLGPTIRLTRHERVRIHFVNELETPSIVHWHGLIVPEAADGLPRQAIQPKERYTYDFTVANRAGVYLYHAHPHMQTALQVYRGLAGVLIVDDPVEEKIGLPAEAQDLCLVIQDRRVDANNRFVHQRGMMDHMFGVLGDTILVNGQPNASFRAERRPYRLRLVNASNARIYKFAWSDSTPMQIIGTGAGLLSGDEGPLQKQFVVLAPGQRVEIWEDFARRKPGTTAALVSEKFAIPTGMRGMMGKGMGGGMMMKMNMGGDEFRIARFAIQDGDAKPSPVPKLPGRKQPVGETRREIKTTLAFRMMRGFLNGRTYKENDLLESERLKLNEPVAWIFDNASEMGMQMPHPMHIHAVQFRVIDRKGSDGELSKGIIDAGWHDTVLLLPGETVKLHLTPTQPGLFLYHCHNLEHEDMGMMRDLRVAAD